MMVKSLRAIIAALACLWAGTASAQTAADLFARLQAEPDIAARARLLEEAAKRVEGGDRSLDIPADAFRREAAFWQEGVRKAGSYLLFWGDESKIIAGQYWLAPDVRILVYPRAPSRAGGKHTVIVDRGLLPRRLIRGTEVTDIAYEPDPALPVTFRRGEFIDLKATARQLDPFGQANERQAGVRLALTGRSGARLSLIDHTVYRFTFGAGDAASLELRERIVRSTDFELDGHAVYVPQWDVMFDEVTYQRIRAVSEGTMLSSAVFTLAMSLDMSVSRMDECFRTAPASLIEGVRRFRETHDERAAALFRARDPEFQKFWNQGQAVRDFQGELTTRALPCLPQ
jgi:hypothetical protein